MHPSQVSLRRLQTHKEKNNTQNKLLYMEKKNKLLSTRSKNPNTTENGWTVVLVQ